MRRILPVPNLVPAIALALAASVAAASCGASADLAIRADGSAALSMSVEVPAAVDAKLRQFVASGSAAGGASGAASASRPLFDPAAVAASMKSRGVSVRSSEAPTPRSWRGTFAVGDLAALVAADPGLAGAFEYARGTGWASLRFSLDRDNAGPVAGLFPGLDADLLEALQAPAIYDNPVSAAEYRSMLSGLLGKAAAAAIDGAVFTLSVSLPGTAIESGGGAKLDAGRRTASLSVPALDAMVLERPVEFYVRWRE